MREKWQPASWPTAIRSSPSLIFHPHVSPFSFARAYSFFPIQIHANKGPRMFRNEIMTLFWNMIVLFEIILILRLYFYFVNILRHTYLFIFQVVCRHFIGLGNKTSFCLRAVVFNLVPTLFNVCDCVNKLGISIFIMYFCRNLRANLYIYIYSTNFFFWTLN